MRRPWRSMRKLGRQLLAGPYLVWIIGFILLPIVIILYYAFTNTSGAFTWDNIAAIADPVHVKSILLSLKLGFFCTVVCLLLAYPLAMILANRNVESEIYIETGDLKGDGSFVFHRPGKEPVTVYSIEKLLQIVLSFHSL